MGLTDCGEHNSTNRNTMVLWPVVRQNRIEGYEWLQHGCDRDIQATSEAALRCGELVRIAAAGTVGAAGRSSPQAKGPTSLPGRRQAARRSYRWCKPPTSGSSTTSPVSGDITARDAGASLLIDRCVRERW